MKLITWNRIIALLSSVFAASAFAHSGHHLAGGGSFFSGFMHPITGIDHLAAMLMIGVIGGSLAAKVGIRIIAMTAVALIMGFMLGHVLSANSTAELVVSFSLVALPLTFFAMKKKAIVTSLAAMSLLTFGATHGFVIGSEVTGNAMMFGLGTSLSSVCLCLMAFVLARTIQRRSEQALPAAH
ncbi:HupE/UreJ family protein [Echinimonas agarilytica]|uniref:HupE/UreJ family protein n=1 Tax=Echinimonas agarilytica TaxID=1215918 RepID=A0AA41W5M3_9GAMM|nr:HupE/UreJ family protein [Echinimonas agarilytica]MCM2679158.1 HupE/UreJ family protein [Echinimonas agarilytica]